VPTLTRHRSRTRLIKAGGLLAAAWTLALGGCEDPLGPERDALAAARARWEASAPTAYHFQFRRLCFCGPATIRPVRIQVLEDEVVAVRDVESGQPVTEPLDSFPTIEDLFDEIEDALDREAYRLEAMYDVQFGYPIDVSIDFIEHAVDEEMTLLVSEFEVLPALALAARSTR
jgi:hypothetical protein